MKEKITKILNYFFSGFSFLASKKVIAILELSLFIALLDITTGYQEELKKKELDMITEKQEIKVNTYTQEKNDFYENPSTAADELMNCYKKKVESKDLNEEINTNIKKIEDLFNENNEHFSFLYQDLYSGFTVSYNEESPIFTASTIKAPAMIYLYELASKNEIDLNEELVYTSNFYNGGSGILQTKPQNTSYKVEELIEYAIHDSDNIAYAMLMNRYGRENILKFWSELGTKNIFTLNTIWGVTSAKDASIYMNELYRFYQEDKIYGKKLMEYFQNSTWKLITNKEGYFNTASKGGWSGKAIHDVAIIFEKNPYILVIMSNTEESNYTYLFNNTSKLAGNLHEAYWKYKQEECSKIKQY